jgi:uncharacterized protein DUF1302
MRPPVRKTLRLVSAAILVIAVQSARATVSGDRYEMQARLVVQNTFHHNGVSAIDWVQERNEIRLDLKYDLVPSGTPFLGFVQRARMNMLYRGRYDSVFDVRESYKDRHYNRDDFRFPEGEYPRELFLDLEFAGALRPLGVRIGRQQVVWGEADLFRSIDVVNPLRLDQNELLGDDFADYREPLWIAKFLYDIGPVGSELQNAGLEFFYTPNSRPITNRLVFGEAFRIGADDNNPVTGFTRPNAVPFSQVRYPWELSRVGPHYAEAQDFAELPPPFGNSDFVYLIDDDTSKRVFAFRQSEAGARFLAQSFGVDFTVNYIFKRAEIPGTALVGEQLFCPQGDPESLQSFNIGALLGNPGASILGAALCRSDGGINTRPSLLEQALVAAATGQNDSLILRCVRDKEPLYVLDSIHGPGNPGPGANLASGCLTAKFWYPWTHIFGMTATYNDYDYTGAVFRVEESFSTKEPRNGVPPLAGPRARDFPRERDFATNGMRDTMVWRSMIGFDYLRALNIPGARRWPTPLNSFFGQDQWLFSVQFFDEYYSHYDHQIGLGDSVTDRMQQFNPLLTFVATGFFVQQRVRPWIAVGYDVNADFPFAWLQAEYNVGKQWSIRAGDVMWLGSRHAESFLYLNKYADRDNLFLRVTYFLL